MAAGVVVFDCRPTLLPVSVNVSGIGMQTVRPAMPPAEPVVVPPEREQQFGGAALVDYSDPELDVIPLLDSGTDYQDELSSLDSSPMVISPIVALLPSQVEEDVDLAHILAEFGTLPAILTPIADPYEKEEMPPAEYRPPEVPTDVFAAPAGPDDGVNSPRDLTAPAFPTPERKLLFPVHTGKRWQSFYYSLLRQRCLSQEIQWIAFESARMSLMCLARARSMFVFLYTASF